jgi:plastocyanin
MADEGTGPEFAFGEPADPTEADRTIEIVAADDFRYDPKEVTVAPGETITFHIVNDGQLVHTR